MKILTSHTTAYRSVHGGFLVFASRLQQPNRVIVPRMVSFLLVITLFVKVAALQTHFLQLTRTISFSWNAVVC